MVAAVGVLFPQLTALGERWALSGERKCTALLDDFPEKSGLGA
ncbi:hypothetical protein ALO95_101123 [Pseudomonas syringae pv. antirrhini]|uniref:Uncharacterized protein n=5 Tax=Pseudomonas syringae group genomosp. 3 TaxID=251701 RepID=A0A3M3RP11_9PSED|nr:Unknown protein sequence [Pseudomonas syringae pv. maculicola]KPB98063.1 Unknown protein sequence [Pseudomonas syringae pv. maculicola str. M6]KPW44701.1 hypothetical protein ALO88_101325 [Pseudomonas syringae pv. antirrhini]KPZ14698.1 hypothetical protein ALO40_101357 [Pseudomonas syringae pv. viburni]RMM09989.1 hypothetical protein ALQ85_101223 [Pseudomonas syringae]RMN45384.1 hypothetical protein ALQ59_101364 [Pseudomonas syringae pv. apii]RMO75190.1 hypothetical protein ALQ36_101912 [P